MVNAFAAGSRPVVVAVVLSLSVGACKDGSTTEPIDDASFDANTRRDAAPRDDASQDGTTTTTDGGMDARADGSPGDGGDGGEGGGPGNDGATPSTCTLPQLPARVVDDPGMVPRPVSLVGTPGGYFVGATRRMSGTSAYYVTSISPSTGLIQQQVDVSSQPSAALGGGGLAVDGSGIVAVWNSNANRTQDIYARPLNASGQPAGSVFRVTDDDDLSDGAQVVRVGAGWLVTWHSFDEFTRRKRLMSVVLGSGVNGVAAGPSNVWPPAGSDSREVAEPYLLFGDGTQAAVLYLVSGMTSDGGTIEANVFLQRLDAAGAPLGPRVFVTEMGRASDFGAALGSGIAAVAWTEDLAGAALHARTIDLSTLNVSQRVDFTSLGRTVTSPSIAHDPAGGWLVGFRRTLGRDLVLGALRVNESLAVVQAPFNVSVTQTGDLTRLTFGADHTFGMAWSELESTASRVLFRQLRCAP